MLKDEKSPIPSSHVAHNVVPNFTSIIIIITIITVRFDPSL